MKHILLVLFGIVFTFGFSQNPNRIYKSHNEENNTFSVTTNDGQYVFQFYSKDILETTFIPSGEH